MMFSVVIPVYQSEKYLPDCVNSILNQTFNDSFEIILVDDGSTDSSGKIADDFSQQYDNIHVFHKQNGGASSARNYGLKNASGEYVLFIDSDDIVDSSLFEKLHSLLDHGLIIYGMSFDYYEKNKLKRQEILSCKHSGKYSVEDVYQAFKDFFYDNALSSACNKVFKRSILSNHQILFNENITDYEDYDFVIRYLKYIDSVYCIDEPLYHYRNDLDNKDAHIRVKDIEIMMNNMNQLFQTIDSLPDGPEMSQVHSVYANLYMDLFRHHLMEAKYSVAELKEAIEKYFNADRIETSLLSDSNKELFENISNKEYSTILKEIRNKLRINRIKGMIKKLIGKR